MMKHSDIAMVILIAAVSLVAAYLIGGAIINSPESRSTEVEIAVPISSEFSEPSKLIFGEGSINPTEKITIDDANNPKPFENSN